jgi:acid phosphatase class B
MDDMVLAGKSETRIKKVKKELSSKFDIKDLGRLAYFLGIRIVQSQEEKETWMGQPA